MRIHWGVFGTRCLACHSTMIHRAVGVVLERLRLEPGVFVYELSASGALVKYLRRRFRHVTVSEYYDDVEPGRTRNGVQCEDVQRLTFPDQSFHLVTSTELFEHVPDDLSGFREIYRVLKPDGHFIFSVPLADSERTVERALVSGDRVVHRLPPEYHHDRIRGRGKVLAYRTYGYDIRNRLAEAGFQAEIRVVDEEQYGIPQAKIVAGWKRGGGPLNGQAPWSGADAPDEAGRVP